MFKNITSRLKTYLLLFLAVILGLSVLQNVGRRIRIRHEIESARQKVAKLQKDNEELARKIAEAQTPTFMEKEIRNKLGLVKTGETVVVLPDDETLRKLAPRVPTEEDFLPDPNYVKWMKLFF